MRKLTIILVFFFFCIIYLILRPSGYMSSNGKLINDLNSKNHTTTIVEAAYELGERKEKSAIKPLLSHILNPRMSTNLNFKGMNVCYCKLVALEKISGLKPPVELNRFKVDTAAAKFYLNWAINENYIRSKNEIDLTYY